MNRAALTSEIFDLDEELKRMMLSGRRDRGEQFIARFEQFVELRKALQKGISELRAGLPPKVDTLAVDFFTQKDPIEKPPTTSTLSQLYLH